MRARASGKIILAVLLYPSFAWALRCGELFEDRSSFSLTTQKNVFEYSQPSFRPLEEYSQHLVGLQEALKKLQSGQVHFDAGSGMGMASIELVSRKPGVISIAANMRDYWQDFFSFSSESEPRFKNILTALGRATNLPIENRAHARRVLDDLKHRGFELREGPVQRTLSDMIARGERIDLYTDVWGAYAYSADRVRLLELVYQALREGGEARILTQDQVVDMSETEALYHRVRSKRGLDGGSFRFESYLVSLGDPAIQIEGAWPGTLVIRRIPGRSVLGLGLRMVPGTVQYTGKAAFPISVRYEDLNEVN